jgi:hypothetical protein
MTAPDLLAQIDEAMASHAYAARALLPAAREEIARLRDELDASQIRARFHEASAKHWAAETDRFRAVEKAAKSVYASAILSNGEATMGEWALLGDALDEVTRG